MKKQITKDIYDIFPVGAHAKGVVEHGEVEVIIDGYMFELTIQLHSDGISKVLLDSDTPKARTILKKYGASMSKKTLDEIHGEEFIGRIKEIYDYSNTRGTNMCSWTVENFDKLEFKELN